MRESVTAFFKRRRLVGNAKCGCAEGEELADTSNLHFMRLHRMKSRWQDADTTVVGYWALVASASSPCCRLLADKSPTNHLRPKALLPIRLLGGEGDVPDADAAAGVDDADDVAVFGIAVTAKNDGDVFVADGDF